MGVVLCLWLVGACADLRGPEHERGRELCLQTPDAHSFTRHQEARVPSLLLHPATDNCLKEQLCVWIFLFVCLLVYVRLAMFCFFRQGVL